MVLLLALLTAAAPADSAILTGFTHVKQKPDFCGEADVEMALKRMKREGTQDDVFNLSGVDPALGRGAWTNELATAMRALGFDPGRVWNRVDPKKAAEQIDAEFAALHADLKAGQPSVVCMHYDGTPGTTEHFRLVTGYDAKTDEVVYQEPAEDHGLDRRMKRSEFLKLWTFKPSAERWTLIRLRFAPNGPEPKLVREPSPSKAEVAQHVLELRKDLPKDFTVVWEKPFLVIGNEDPARVRARSKDIVKRTTDLLLKDFFPRVPGHIEEAWLFKDAPTYEAASRQRFKTEPDTPYGYYLSSRNAMVMNIRPGYGTLTHEMVHPFMHEAWPDAPGWLNEGLGSLFEQPYLGGEHITGGVNWRLPGLKVSLARKQVPTFKALTHLNRDDFYDDPYGSHYGASRYFCYWLQEKGLLVKAVKRIFELKDEDPTGWKALTEVLGKDPDSFRPEWEQFVNKLERKS